VNEETPKEYETLDKQGLIANLFLKDQKLLTIDQELSQALSALSTKDEVILKLSQQLHNMQRGIFGKKTEKLPAESKQVFLFELEQPESPVQEELIITVPAHTRAPRKKRDYGSLPTEQVVHDVANKQCDCCGNEMSCIGEDVSRELDYVPAKLTLIEHLRPRYACAACKSGGVKQAELPVAVKPLEKTIASANLLASIIVSKYADHLPLHRQEEMFKRLGVDIPRKSMCEWIEGVCENYLFRLHNALKEELLKESYLQADETTIKIQDGITPEHCHTGYFWGALSPPRNIAYFEYSPSRAGKVAGAIFEGYTGHLQTDLYAGYNEVVLSADVRRIACLAHVRRKFIDVDKIAPKEVTAILQMFAKLYHFEKQWVQLSNEERKTKRNKHSSEVLEKLHTYLSALQQVTLPKSPLATAINYALSQWDAILRILDDGIFHLDNNAIERQMKHIAIGRKNFLFAGSHEGARRASAIYSLFATAKLHKVNPHAWLVDVLQTMRSHPVNRVCELLPHNWKPMRTS